MFIIKLLLEDKDLVCDIILIKDCYKFWNCYFFFLILFRSFRKEIEVLLWKIELEF